MRGQSFQDSAIAKQPKSISLESKRDIVRRTLERRGIQSTHFGCGVKDGRIMVMFCRNRVKNPDAIKHISSTVQVVSGENVIRLFGTETEPLADVVGAYFGV